MNVHTTIQFFSIFSLFKTRLLQLHKIELNDLTPIPLFGSNKLLAFNLISKTLIFSI